jgi:NAD+ synthase (glutamine-hydrolysing)
MAQLNQSVGDIAGNRARILEALHESESSGAQILAVPELSITGYPPEDLLLKDSFVAANRRALEEVAQHADEVVAVVGFVDGHHGALYNAAAVCHRRRVVGVYRKQLLPNYGVFDERRYFRPGMSRSLLDTSSGVIGVCICEDIWFDPGPAIALGDAGAQVIININASPFHKAKLAERSRMLGDRARRAAASIVYVNMVGAQDELVFDGGSMVIDPRGEVVTRLPQFEECLAVVDVGLGLGRTLKGTSDEIERISIELEKPRRSAAPVEPPASLSHAAEIYEALKLGLHDYVVKNGFEKVVIGLSGGIDSALTATIAVDALGFDRVVAVAMPSHFSTTHSLDDARTLAANLRINLLEVPIGGPYDAFLKMISQALGVTEEGVAEENLQARIRGNLLMFISNRYGHLVVATGNKSEMACGYATLYGDMAGGFALLKDVFKTEVYELAHWRNSIASVIPHSTLTKPPSAELRADQKDSDSLPPYDVLDPILEGYIERDMGIAELSAESDPSVVADVIALVDKAEYKRRQAPPGPKVTTKAFGRDRRLPITNKWREGASAEPTAEVVGQKGPG